MSSDDKNADDQHIENGIRKNGDSYRKLNKYACASVLAASIVSAMFGYGESIFYLIRTTVMEFNIRTLYKYYLNFYH